MVVVVHWRLGEVTSCRGDWEQVHSEPPDLKNHSFKVRWALVAQCMMGVVKFLWDRKLYLWNFRKNKLITFWQEVKAKDYNRSELENSLEGGDLRHLRVNTGFLRASQWMQSSVIICLLMQKLRETWVRSLSWVEPLEEEMATHSSTLASIIPHTEEPGRLQSMGSQIVRHDLATKHSAEWVNN